MNRIIPGHLLGFTLWLILAIAVFGSIVAENQLDVLWAVLAIVCASLGSQATHLAQHGHENAELTWLEKELWKRHKFWRPASITGATIFFMMILV